MKTLVLILLLATLTTPAAEAIVKVYTGTNNDRWSATAFAVKDNLMVTAAHTFEHTFKKGLGEHFILRNGRREPVQILKIDYDQDICVLKTSANDQQFSMAGGTPGSTVSMTGFKGDDKQATTQSGHCTKKKKYIETDFSSPGGISGAPLLDETGVAVGMCKGSFGRKTWCVTAEKISAFLEGLE